MLREELQSLAPLGELQATHAAALERLFADWERRWSECRECLPEVIQLTPILEAASKEGLVILWVYVSSCLYDETEIQHYQAAHDVAKPLDGLKPSERGDVLVAICRKIKAAANVVGPSPEAERGAARQQSALSGVRDGEQLQEHFFAIVNRIPELVDASYLRKCRLQIESALMEANGGAAFAESFAEGSKEKAAGFIKNGMKRYRLQLPAQVAPVILALANLMQKADSAQGELFKQTVCAVTPVELCGWILADALYSELSTFKSQRCFRD